jgi:RimJ/RimL family protein N-acetyltransferase
MSEGPILTTQRLILRPPVAADFDAYADYVSDAATMAFIGGAQPRALAWRSFMVFGGGWALDGFSMFFVFERDAAGAEGRFLGRVGPWRPAEWPGTEVGWGLRADAQGKGYAAEAAAASIDFAFDRLGWTEVIHTIDPANTASQALAQRLGSSNLGPCHLPAPHDKTIDCWGQSRAQWRSRSR